MCFRYLASLMLAFCFFTPAPLPSTEPVHAKPIVRKVEPPNWWIGMKRQRVELMLYGDHLQNASATCSSDLLKVENVDSSENGHYAFVDIHVNEDAVPGTVMIQLTSPNGEVSVPFELKSRSNEKGHQGFGPEDVIYLITPDRFANGNVANDRVFVDEYDPRDPRLRHGGDLQGIIDHLDYLTDLGITAIWLNPVLENRGVNSYHGYKTTDYYRIDPRFGSNDDYRRLVTEAHGRNIKVIFDHISNHVGLKHPWVADPPAEDWFHGTLSHHLTHKHFLYSISDPYADPETRKELNEFWFVDRMPDLNQQNERLSRYLIQNAIWWAEFSQLDGFREDTYPYNDLNHMRRFVHALEKEYPAINVVGEAWALEPAYIAQFQADGPLSDPIFGHLKSVMDFPMMNTYRSFIQRESQLRDIYQRLAIDFVYGDPRMLVTFVDNHDTPRARYLVRDDVQRVKLAYQLLLTTRGIPQLLYGTEIGMKGGPSHVQVRADFPGGFPPARRNAFTSAGRTAEESEWFGYLRHLLHLRKEYPALSRGELTHFPPQNDVYVYIRSIDDQVVIGIANGSSEPHRVDLGRFCKKTAFGYKDLFSGQVLSTATVIVPPEEGMLLEVVNDRDD